MIAICSVCRHLESEHDEGGCNGKMPRRVLEPCPCKITPSALSRFEEMVNDISASAFSGMEKESLADDLEKRLRRVIDV